MGEYDKESTQQVIISQMQLQGVLQFHKVLVSLTSINLILLFDFFRSWDKVCVILRGTQIRFYKDIKAYKTTPDATYRGEVPIDVVGATAEIASDYKKKPHVFRLK